MDSVSYFSISLTRKGSGIFLESGPGVEILEDIAGVVDHAEEAEGQRVHAFFRSRLSVGEEPGAELVGGFLPGAEAERSPVFFKEGEGLDLHFLGIAFRSHPSVGEGKKPAEQILGLGPDGAGVSECLVNDFGSALQLARLHVAGSHLDVKEGKVEGSLFGFECFELFVKLGGLGVFFLALLDGGTLQDRVGDQRVFGILFSVRLVGVFLDADFVFREGGVQLPFPAQAKPLSVVHDPELGAEVGDSVLSLPVGIDDFLKIKQSPIPILVLDRDRAFLEKASNLKVLVLVIFLRGNDVLGEKSACEAEEAGEENEYKGLHG